MSTNPIRPLRCFVLIVGLLGCSEPSATDDEASSETTQAATDDGQTETGDHTDGTVSLIGETCTPALGDCSPGVHCCSTDPAALDLDNLAAIVPPAYLDRGTSGGVPLFADLANAASRRGVCIPDDWVPDPLVGAPGCPIPCNPHWSASDVNAICGPNQLCCQDVELDPSDCVLDPALGNAGCWRPVTGFDIVGLGGLEATQWGPNDHATAQDPGLAADGACETVIAGLPANVDVDAFRAACRRRLTVADQRGTCLPDAYVSCPYTSPSYIDACEQLNLDANLGGC